MDRQKVHDIEGDSNTDPPSNIINNLSIDEEILYKSKGIEIFSIKKIFKFIIPIFQIAIIMKLLISSLLLGVTEALKMDLSMIAMIFCLIAPWIIWLLVVKLNIFDSVNHFVLSNKAVYIFPRKFEYLERIELTSLTSILLKKLKTGKNLVTRGILDFIYPRHYSYIIIFKTINRISVGEVNDILTKYNIIESIFWLYNNVNERIDAIKEELNAGNPPLIGPTNQESIRLKNRIKNHNIEIVISSIIILICSILMLMQDRIVFLTCLLIIIVCGSTIMGIITFDFRIRQILPSTEGKIQITQNGIKLMHEKGTIVLDFDLDIIINLKVIPIQANNKEIILIGTITIQVINKPNLKIKFGPTTEIMKVLELLYLNFLFWKNQNHLLLSKDDLLNLRNKQVAISLKELKKEKLSLSKLGLSEDQEDHIKKILNLNEELLTIYQPERKIKKIIIWVFLFIIGVILLIFYLLNFTLVFPLLTLILNFTCVIIGMILVVLSPLRVYDFVSRNNSFYVFTNQKLIVKTFKKYHEVPYKDFSTILLNEGRKSDIISINFKNEEGINLNAKLEGISLRVQKNSDLYGKIISYKRSFT